MKYIGRLLGWLLLGLNILIVMGMLFCAYSPYLDPVRHPVLACSGLAFPIFLILTVLFLLFWLVVYYKYALASVLGMLCCLSTIYTFCPLNFFREEAPEGSIKILSYNVMGFEADHPDTPDNPNMILKYLKESNADIICMQEYSAGGRLKQSDIDRALSEYTYKNHQKAGKNGGQIACYSRFPILSANPVKYTSEFNGSILYQIKIENDTILLINNHLESNKLTIDDREKYVRMIKSPEASDVKASMRTLLKKLSEAIPIRAQQADSIAQIIRQQKGKSLIVCGDFNTSPISYTHRVISENLTDAFTESGRGPGISYHKNGFYFRIDNILVSPDFKTYQCTVDNSLKNSDHYPIWCYVTKNKLFP